MLNTIRFTLADNDSYTVLSAIRISTLYAMHSPTSAGQSNTFAMVALFYLLSMISFRDCGWLFI